MTGRLAAGLLAGLLLAPLAQAAELPQGRDLPPYVVADPAAAPVTQENLLASERFWPYRVKLVRAFQPAGAAKPLPAGSVGVLIRVEEGGKVRADFGRDGLYSDVPVDATDLLASANRVRAGEETKDGPNFAIAILPRLADPTRDELAPWSVIDSLASRGYLLVFADPFAKGFEELASALSPLRARSDLLTVLFPQGPYNDARMRERLRTLDWRGPFVVDHLSEVYTETLIDDPTELPRVAYVSPDGQLLFADTAWKRDVLDALTGRVEATLGPAPRSIAGSSTSAPALEAAAPQTQEDAPAAHPEAAAAP